MQYYLKFWFFIGHMLYTFLLMSERPEPVNKAIFTLLRAADRASAQTHRTIDGLEAVGYNPSRKQILIYRIIGNNWHSVKKSDTDYPGVRYEIDELGSNISNDYHPETGDERCIPIEGNF